MEKVKVKKDELLAKLQENFEKWKALHIRAMEAYWKAVDSALRKARTRANKKDRAWGNGVFLTPPDDHENTFKTAIKMVEMSCDEVIEITEEEFSSYILNKWGWRRDYITRASCYLGVRGSTGPTGPSGADGESGDSGLDF